MSAPDHPAFAVTADAAALILRGGRLHLLTIRRDRPPFVGSRALPGTFLGPDEVAGAAAARAVLDKTGLNPDDLHLEQLATYSEPDRDPRMRTVSVVYLGLAVDPGEPTEGEWLPVTSVPDEPWAFDHARIVEDAVERARSKLEYTTLATALLPETFTIPDLRRVYEAVWGREVHPSNFRRKVLQATEDFVVPTGDHRPANANGSGRPTAVYRAGGATALHPPLTRSHT
ncbi:NUDIX hydrolase [Euzebya tangerina]|uniref:NUDIX hydrolase n=1 Tax=Euzebya tangerina TaxID=591198 RepID=UPI000E3184E1|nr:NUDIX domain-containing protein [Euzebya tangerina]